MLNVETLNFVFRSNSASPGDLVFDLAGLIDDARMVLGKFNEEGTVTQSPQLLGFAVLSLAVLQAAERASADADVLARAILVSSGKAEAPSGDGNG